MADKSGIEWTEATWNPIAGCKAVSPGCDHCYAAREAAGRLSKLPAYAGLAVYPEQDQADAYRGRPAPPAEFTGEVRMLPDRMDQPLRWRKPRRIFVNSMSDLFHEDVPAWYIAEILDVIRQTPRHTYQILTKRHARMRSLLSRPEFAELTGWPLPNVWLGVSVENQHWADVRIPALQATPAAVRWLSCEPLLGSIPGLHLSGIGWVVAGGESGPGARVMAPDWVRGIRDQCEKAGVPFLFKQWGEWAPTGWMGAGYARPDRWFVSTSQPRVHPKEGEEMVRMGKRKAGRLLDGVLHDEYPAA